MRLPPNFSTPKYSTHNFISWPTGPHHCKYSLYFITNQKTLKLTLIKEWSRARPPFFTLRRLHSWYLYRTLQDQKIYGILPRVCCKWWPKAVPQSLLFWKFECENVVKIENIAGELKKLLICPLVSSTFHSCSQSHANTGTYPLKFSQNEKILYMLNFITNIVNNLSEHSLEN